MLPNKLKEMVKCIKYHMLKAKADSEALLDLYRFLFQSCKRENAVSIFEKDYKDITEYLFLSLLKS